MSYPIAHIVEILKANTLAPLHDDFVIEHLLLDSRKLIFPTKSLFFALAGNRNNGHDYIEDLYQAGLRNFVVSEKIEFKKFPEANFLFVKNTLTALQALASHHRTRFNFPVIGITGSNGKTIVKEWLFQLLQPNYSIARSPKSYNSQIGVPLSVWPINQEHTLGIFEAGISQREEMKNLAPIIQCNIGLFTNLGTAHSEGFVSDEEKIKEKMILFATAETLIYSVDDSLVQSSFASQTTKQHLRWSKSGKEAELSIHHIEQEDRRTTISALFNEVEVHITIPFTDDAYIENAIHCWAVLLHLGIDNIEIAKRMLELEPVGMRLELKTGINNCILVNDSYNSDLNGLEIALNFMAEHGVDKKQHLILSDILQSGQTKKVLYQQVAQLIAKKGIHQFTGIGEAIPELKHHLEQDIEARFFSDTETFLKQLKSSDFSNQIILIKGARSFSFERIANRLARQIHKTVLEVNLSAMLRNFNVYSSYLNPTTLVMVMVKASAYGSGSLEVARMLEYQKVDFFAVAYGDEGIDLRKAGIKTPILVLNPEEATMEALIRFGLDPEIYSIETLQQLLKHLPANNQKINIHLKLDTGMHRLGFEKKDIPTLLHLIKSNPQLKVRSIFSHLSSSDDARHDQFSKQQIEVFLNLYEILAEGLGYRPLRHILNSSGISRFPEHQMDMVRLGIGLYGIDSTGMIQDKLETVHTLKATISQIKEVAANESIGYSRGEIATQDMRIGTISIGYADGLLRTAGNSNYQVMIGAKKAPIVGNVCMDMCMIDLSDLPEAQEGDEVIIFGKEMPVQELAKTLNTIPYEVFTNISSRVKRVYFQE